MSECTCCGASLDGNHAVRDGHRYCFECKPQLVTGDTDIPPTADASKAAFVPVAALLNGGSAR